MFSKFKNWFLYTFFQSSMLASFNQGVYSGKNAGYNQAIDQRINDKKESDLFELKKFMDQKIIVFGNGWEDPVFGYGTGIELITKAQQPVLCFKNAITGEVSITFGKVFLYNESLMNAILMLNPYQRWELATGQSLLVTENDKLSDLAPPEALVATLKTIGYLDKDFVFEQEGKYSEAYNTGVGVGQKLGHEAGCEKVVTETWEATKVKKVFDLQPFLFRKVISISSGFDDVFFGICRDIDITNPNIPCLVIEDAFDKENVKVAGKTFLYSDSIMNALLSLSSKQRWELAYGKPAYMWSDTLRFSDTMSVDDLISKLKDVEYLDQNFVFEQKSKELSIFNEGVREGEKNKEIKNKPLPRTKPMSKATRVK